MNKIIPIKEQLDESLAIMTADSVLVRLFGELDQLQSPAGADLSWFKSVFDILMFAQQIEVGFGHARAYALAIIKTNWNSVDLDIRKQYGYDFNRFAKLTTKKEISTINNYIRVAQIWFVDKINPGKQIEIIVRDNEGRPILDETGKQLTQWVDFVPFTVDLTKLLAVSSRAANGTMTPKLWEMLVDSFYSCEDLQIEASGTPKEPDFYRPSFFFLGPGLYAEIGAKTVCIAEELNWAGYETDQDVKECIDLLIGVLNILRDEDRILEMERDAY